MTEGKHFISRRDALRGAAVLALLPALPVATAAAPGPSEVERAASDYAAANARWEAALREEEDARQRIIDVVGAWPDLYGDREAWRRDRRKAEETYGLQLLIDAQLAIFRERDALLERLVSLPSKTLNDLRAKARCAASDQLIGESITLDLLEMADLS